jgi:chaperonin GroES
MAKTNIQPLFDNILIKPLEAEAKTASGIILPDTAQEKPQMGKIVAVGPGKSLPREKKKKLLSKSDKK